VAAVIELRIAESDADLESWRRVRRAVLPNELTITVEELRARSTPERLLLVAFRDGELAGAGLANRSDSGTGYTQPRVLPQHRRRGVGSKLLLALAAHAESAGFTETAAAVESPGGAEFAQRFGFEERMRQIEQVRRIEARERPADVPEGIELVPLRERPDLAERLFRELARDALRDLAVDQPIDISEEIWWRQWLTSVDAAFVALAGGEIVGMAALLPDPDHPERAENALTAVRRDHRRRGIARALKQHTIHVAPSLGLREIYTWTQTGNEATQELNRSLGYVDRTVIPTVRAPLPLRVAR
jgi:mycothiol synthase